MLDDVEEKPSYDEDKMVRTLTLIVNKTVGRDYTFLAQNSEGRGTEEQFREAFASYPFAIVAPPAYTIATLSDGIIEFSDPPLGWAVDVLLWQEDGRSDLTLVTSVYDCEGDLYKFTIDDVDVL